MTEDEMVVAVKREWGIETRLVITVPLLPLVSLLTHGTMSLGVAKGLATGSGNTMVLKELDRMERQMALETSAVFE